MLLQLVQSQQAPPPVNWQDLNISCKKRLASEVGGYHNENVTHPSGTVCGHLRHSNLMHICQKYPTVLHDTAWCALCSSYNIGHWAEGRENKRDNAR